MVARDAPTLARRIAFVVLAIDARAITHYRLTRTTRGTADRNAMPAG